MTLEVSWLYRRVASRQYYAINHVPVTRYYAMQRQIMAYNEFNLVLIHMHIHR